MLHMRRSKWVSWLGLFVVVGLLAACVAPGAAPAASSGAAADSGQKVKVVYWAHNFEPRVELDKKYIDQFMKENPNIEVEYNRFYRK